MGRLKVEEDGIKTGKDEQNLDTKLDQTKNSTNTFIETLQIFLKSYLLGGSDENVPLTSLSCVNALYLVFVFWFVFINCLLYTNLARDRIERELNVCRNNLGQDSIFNCVSVETLTNRIGFTLAGTFITLAFICLTTSSNKVHERFWLIKLLFILTLLCVSFMIPSGYFDIVWSVICFFSSLVFYFIETVLIFDFATTASGVFVKRITEEHSKLWYFLWLLVVWMIYVTVIMFMLWLYVIYTDNCGLSALLITTLFILCLLFTVLALYFSEKRTGLLHTALCTLYLLLLTAVAVNHEGFCGNDFSTHLESASIRLLDEILKYLEIILGFLLITYAALRCYSKNYYHVNGLTISRDAMTCTRSESNDEESLNSQKETSITVFNPPGFLILLGIFALSTTSKLTSLRTGKYDEPRIDDSTAFLLRSLTIILIIILMIWSQIFPFLNSNENPFDLLALGKTFFKFQLKLSRRILIDGCGCCNGPVASRYIFTILYVLGVLFSCVLYVPEIRHSLSKSTYFCTTSSTIGNCLSTDPVYMAVYRICFAMATFYLLFAVILVCVDNTRDLNDTSESRTSKTRDSCEDPRVDLQHKAWPVKICLFCSLLLASFLLPNEFSKIWIYTALTGTIIFTILQLILLIYWTKTTGAWVQVKIDSSTSRLWTTLMISITILMICLSLSAVVAFYVFFARSWRCITNTILISLNLILIVATSFISVHPKVYVSRLFQCFVIVIFSLYLTWSGLSHSLDKECNLVANYIAEVGVRPNLNIQTVLDLFFTVITIIYFSSRTPKITESIRSTYEFLRKPYKSSQNQGNPTKTFLIKSQSEWNEPIYNFTLFHIIYFFASLHATIILTNWFIPTNSSKFKLSVNWSAMCVKVATSNLTLLIYLWFTTAQILLE